MAGQTRIGQIADSDYERLLALMSATEKGRAFLAEFGRRSRPEETEALLQSLEVIERTIGGIRDQLQPERIADELRHVAMTLEIAVEGVAADAEGDDSARRMALVNCARGELAALAASLAGQLAPPPPIEAEPGAEWEPWDEPATVENAFDLLAHPAEPEGPPAER
jgi:hypothetical protein